MEQGVPQFGHPHFTGEIGLEQMLQDGPVPVIIYNPDSLQILSANEAAIALYGYSRMEMAGLSLLDLHLPEDRAWLLERLAGTRGQPVNYNEVRHRHRTGRPLYVQLHALPLVYRGSPARMILLHDASEYHRAVDALRQSETRWRSLVEQASDGIFINGTNGRFTEVNRSACEMVGLTREQITGKTYHAIFGPEQQATHEAAYERALSGEALVYEWQFGDRYFETSLAPLRDDNGQVTGTIGIARDLTAQKEAERALWESEEKFRNLVEDSPAGIYIIQDGRFVYVNPALTAFSGLTREEILALPDAGAVIQPQDYAAYQANVARRLSGEIKSVHYEVHAIHKEGKILNIDVMGTVTTYQGRPAIIGTALDITERKRTEAFLRLIESAVESASDGIVVADAEGRLRYLNPAFRKLTGFDADSLQKLGGPLSLLENKRLKRKVLSGLVRNGTWQGDARVRSRNDELCDVLVRINTITDEAGQRIGVVGICTDVSERKEAEERIRLSESRYHALSELISAYGISYVIDKNGKRRIEWVTDSFETIFGRGATEKLERDWMSVVHPDDRDLYQRLSRTLLQNEPVQFEFRATRMDGETRWIRTIAFPEWDPAEQRVCRVVGAGQDVTWQKQAETELIEAKDRAEEMNRLKSAFLANMSHEIRTPLTSIMGFADVLSGNVPPKSREFALLIRKSGQRLLDTLNSVLDLAQLEGRGLKFRFETYNVVRQVHDVLQMFQVTAQDRGLYLHLDSEQERLRVTTDRAAVERILNNLVSNALKFTPKGGVTVTLNTGAEYLTLQVADTGVGISEDFLPHVFDEFKQESTGIARDYEGSGLGLTITRRLVELLGGTIQVDSKKGQGSVFTVVLPLDGGPNAPNDVIEHSGRNRRKQVLVVDDDENTRRLVTHMLGRQFDLDTAVDSVDALTRARKTIYDVVLLDINLGSGPSGEAVLKDLKEVPGYEEVPIVAMTAYALPGDRKRFLNGGFDDYISKPFAMKQLIDTILRLGTSVGR